jgi:cytochrome P450
MTGPAASDRHLACEGEIDNPRRAAVQMPEDRDYFTDHTIAKDPYPFFDALRARGPVYQPADKDYLIVSGFAEAIEILNNHRDFSAIIGLAGAGAPLPFAPEGSDITDQIEANRSKFLGGDQVVMLDDEPHTKLRSLMNRLFTPSRLKANEEYMTALAHEMVGAVVAKGECDLIGEIATPFVTMVIADLLGVPAEDRQHFMDLIEASPAPGNLDASLNSHVGETHPMVAMTGYFYRYISERQANPRNDILTELAQAEYSDGTRPSMMDLMTLGVFIFGAGQDTSAKLLGNAMRFIIDVPGLQDQLRADPALIPAMLEEVLRLEGSTKQLSRLVRRDTKIGDLPVKAGTRVLIGIPGGNRDPRRWEAPGEFRLDRPKIREHIAFGRGKHVCAGAPLARAEVRVILEQFLAQTVHIDLDEAEHGPRNERRFDFEPSFIIRGLSTLRVKITS